MRGPEIVDLAQAQVFAVEAGRFQALGDQALAAGIVRGNRRAGDEIASELQDVGHVSRRRSAS